MDSGDAAGEGGLAAAGLADQAQRLARAQFQAHVVYRVHAADLALDQDAVLDREVLLHVLDAQQDLAGGDFRAFLQDGQLGHVRARVVRHGRSSTSSGWIVGVRISLFLLPGQVAGV